MVRIRTPARRRDRNLSEGYWRDVVIDAAKTAWRCAKKEADQDAIDRRAPITTERSIGAWLAT